MDNTEPNVTEDQIQEEEGRQDEIIELEWEIVKEVFELKNSLNEVEEYLSQFLLQHEKGKQSLLRRMNTIETALYDSARIMRDNKGVSKDLTYELKLPQSPGEKGYLLRKEM